MVLSFNFPFEIINIKYREVFVHSEAWLPFSEIKSKLIAVEQIQKINHVAGIFLSTCYEKYKKIIAIDNDDEFDKQYDDFTDEYGDCIVVVKNNKN